MTRPAKPIIPRPVRTRANLIANFAGQGWSALIGLVFVPVYIKLLGIEAFALIGFYTMLQQWLTLLDLGIMPTTAREMARFTSGATAVEAVRDLLRSFETICLAIAALVAIVLALLAGWIAAHWLNAEQLPVPTVATAIGLMGVVIGARFGEALYRSCLVGLQRQVWLNGATAVFATLRNVGAIAVLIWADRSITAYFLWNVAVSITAVLFLGWKVHRLLPGSSRRPRFSREALAGIGRFAAGMFGINLLALILIQADKLILSRLLSLEAYGYYMLAATVTGMLFSLSMPVTQAIFPRMVEEAARKADTELARLFHAAAQLLTAIVAPAALALAVFAEPLLYVWSGDPALAAASAPLLRLLAIGTLLNLLMQLPYHLQVAHGWTSLALRANLVAVLALVPALLWLVPRYGAPAAAWAWIGVNLFYLVIVAPLTFRRLLPKDLSTWVLRDTAVPIAAAGLVLGGAAAFGFASAGGRLASAVAIAIAGALAFGCALLSVGTVRDRLKAGMR